MSQFARTSECEILDFARWIYFRVETSGLKFMNNNDVEKFHLFLLF